MRVSASVFSACLATGAALLAVWLYVRFPRVGDDGWVVVFAHMGLAFVVLQLVMPPALALAVEQGTVVAAVSAAIGIALPAFTYVFLSSMWFLRLAQGLLRGAR